MGLGGERENNEKKWAAILTERLTATPNILAFPTQAIGYSE